MSGLPAPYSLCMTPTKSPSQHDEILKTLQLYIDGSKQGKSELMRPAFHPQASFFGYAGDQLAVERNFCSIGLIEMDQHRVSNLASSALTSSNRSLWFGSKSQTGRENW
jgi:hypothetical protein